MAKHVYKPNKLTENTRLLVDSIARDNYIGTKRMGRLPIDAPAYLRRQNLMQRAADEELENLVNHPNHIVALVAFEGLYYRGYDRVPELLKDIAAREATIQYIKGDVSTEIPALLYAYVYVMRFNMPGEPTPTELDPALPKYELAPESHMALQQKIIDSRNGGSNRNSNLR